MSVKNTLSLLTVFGLQRNTKLCLRNRNTLLSYYYRKERFAEMEIDSSSLAN